MRKLILILVLLVGCASADPVWNIDLTSSSTSALSYTTLARIDIIPFATVQETATSHVRLSTTSTTLKPPYRFPTVGEILRSLGLVK